MDRTAEQGSPGIYTGGWELPADLVELTSLAATLDDGAGFSLSQAGSLAVQLVGPAGEILAGSHLMAWSASWSSSAQVVLDGPGSFTLTGLAPANDYTVRLLGAGSQVLAQQQDVVVTAGLEYDLILQVTDLPAKLRLRFTDEGGAPVPGMEVVFTDPAGQYLEHSLSGSDGWTMDLPGVMAGDQVQATVKAGPLPYYDGASQVYTLAPGANLETMVLEPIPAAVMTGRVVTDQGQPLDGARVTARQHADNRVFNFTTTTDDDGQFTIELIAGEAQVYPASPDPRYHGLEQTLTLPGGQIGVGDLVLGTLGVSQVKLEVYTKYLGSAMEGPMELDERTARTLRLYAQDSRGHWYDFEKASDPVRIEADGRSASLLVGTVEVTLDANRQATAKLELVQQGGVINGRVLGVDFWAATLSAVASEGNSTLVNSYHGGTEVLEIWAPAAGEYLCR